jgi:L-malate glycosyltransferase
MLLPDHIVAPSHGTAERIRAITGGGVPVTVVPNGIDTAGLAGLPAEVQCWDIIYVGRLITHKNVDALLRGVAALAGDGQRITCRIVGDGPERAALHHLAASLGIAEQVQFDGRLDEHEDVLTAMKTARLFGFLSEREGFGLAALEALACGLPMITYDHPNNHARHLLVDRINGRLLPDLDPRAVADALQWCLEHHPRLAPAAKASAQDYDWDTITAQMSKVYTA